MMCINQQQANLFHTLSGIPRWLKSTMPVLLKRHKVATVPLF